MENADTTVKALFSVVSGVTAYLFGGFDNIIVLLLFLMGADIVAGFMAGVYNENLNRKIMWRGGIKKMITLLVVSVSVIVEVTFPDVLPLREIVIMYYIVEEFISFTQNVSIFVTLPESFIQYFAKHEEDKTK